MLRERNIKVGGTKGELAERLAEHMPVDDDEMVTPADAAAGASHAAARNAAKASRAAADLARYDKTKDSEKNLEIKIEKLLATRKARKEWGPKKKENQTEGVGEAALNTPIRMGGVCVCTTTSNHPFCLMSSSSEPRAGSPPRARASSATATTPPSRSRSRLPSSKP